MDSEEEDLALLGYFFIFDEEKKKKRKHRFWVRDIYKKRDEQGVFNNREYFLR